MHKIRQAFEAVEGGEILMDIVTVGPDDIIELGQGCSVRPFPVQHRSEDCYRTTAPAPFLSRWVVTWTRSSGRGVRR